MGEGEDVSMPSAPVLDIGSIKITTVGEFSEIAAGEEVKEMYVLGSIKCPAWLTDVSSERAPIRVTAVIDRSSSMRGRKLDLVRETLQFVLSNLRPCDSLGIISYDSRVKEEFKLQSLEGNNIQRAREAINGINSHSGTDILSGIMAGLEQMEGNAIDSDKIHKIMKQPENVQNDQNVQPQVRTVNLGGTRLRLRPPPLQAPPMRQAITEAAPRLLIVAPEATRNAGDQGEDRQENKAEEEREEQNRGQEEVQQEAEEKEEEKQEQEEKEEEIKKEDVTKEEQKQEEDEAPVDENKSDEKQDEDPTAEPAREDEDDEGDDVIVFTTADSARLSGGGVQSSAASNNSLPQPPPPERPETAPRGRTMVRSVWLFTDGEPTSGVRDPAVIQSRVAARLNTMADPCTVYTFGFGARHNATLLKGLADAGAGTYYYIENAESIGDAFADCLGGLASVVAQDLSLHVDGTNECLISHVETAFPHEFGGVSGAGKQNCTIRIRDMCSEEQRDVTVRLFVPKSVAPSLDEVVVARWTLTYRNMLKDCNEVVSAELKLKRPEQATTANVVPPEIDRQRNRTLCTNTLKAARRRAALNDFDGARKVLWDAMNAIMSSPTGNDPLCVVMTQDLMRAREGMRDRTTYLRGGEQTTNTMSSMHEQQRGYAYTVNTMTTTLRQNMTTQMYAHTIH